MQIVHKLRIFFNIILELLTIIPRAIFNVCVEAFKKAAADLAKVAKKHYINKGMNKHKKGLQKLKFRK